MSHTLFLVVLWRRLVQWLRSNETYVHEIWRRIFIWSFPGFHLLVSVAGLASPDYHRVAWSANCSGEKGIAEKMPHGSWDKGGSDETYGADAVNDTMIREHWQRPLRTPENWVQKPGRESVSAMRRLPRTIGPYQCFPADRLDETIHNFCNQFSANLCSTYDCGISIHACLPFGTLLDHGRNRIRFAEVVFILKDTHGNLLDDLWNDVKIYHTSQ